MKIVTGGRGPLGRAFQALFNSEGNYYFPTSSSCDLTKEDCLEKYCEQNQINPSLVEGIIHLAAFSGGARLSAEKPATMISKNLLMAINVMEFAAKFNIKKVLMCMSTTCYSPKIESPTEEDLHKYPIEGMDYAYAWAKRSMEPLMRGYNKEHNLKSICVIVNGIIGPGMNYKEGEMILPAALIKRFLRTQNLEIPDFSILTDGSEIREYTYSYDLAKAIYWCFANQEPGTVLNIGNTEKITVRNVAEIIAKALDIDPKKLKFGSKELITRSIQSTNNDKFVNLSSFKYTNIEEAIKDTIQSDKLRILSDET